jgi:hypothetical protein
MPTPPDPLVLDLLLTVAAKLGWRFTMRAPDGVELGELFTPEGAPRPLLMVAGPARGSVAWAIVELAPRDLSPHLMTRATADILCGGALRDDGAVLYQGKAYRLRAICPDRLAQVDAASVESAL